MRFPFKLCPMEGRFAKVDHYLSPTENVHLNIFLAPLNLDAWSALICRKPRRTTPNSESFREQATQRPTRLRRGRAPPWRAPNSERIRERAIQLQRDQPRTF